MIMEKHILKIEFEADEGALVRLLGLIQRRGFVVESIAMPESTGTLKAAHLTVRPLLAAYRIDVLQRQITRLYEVRAVTLVEPKPPRGVLGFLRGPIVGFHRKAQLPKGTTPCLPENSSHAS
jgi:acetolactate synthase regulatory subunit